MPRPRVLSFMTQWGGGLPKSPTSSAPGSPSAGAVTTFKTESPLSNVNIPDENGIARSPSTPPRNLGDKSSSRPSSMVIPYQPTMADIAQDTPPELQPIFSYLNSHSNKLYQEGYFLKLHDLDSRGRPSVDRVWNECFAQLVGTVLSLWDAAQLDAAGEDGEVIPTFINLTDASIKMIESLPMNGVQGQSLQNVLSISTAANNRYLLHFNSLHSLTQWTAGIRLAMYEHATLQESYTGSIIAGKGKYLNNVKAIMERARFPTEDWARVRFGAGTPWRRCWCVITPPGEKEYQKAQKSLKKRSAYDRTTPIVKGDIKFYETRKITKKTKPIASITDAFSAYAIYPQSKPLIEQSTLVKVEGLITIHSDPPSTTEGFVFVMPEVHPAVTGFEMMLRWLIPVFDTFALYGRPNRLIADVLDTRSLMFAMPTQRRYGYLELIDVAGLIHTEGSQKWNEREWRKQMKNLTSKRITAQAANPDRVGTAASRRNASGSNLNLPSTATRSSSNLPSTRNAVRFGTADFRSTPSSRSASPGPMSDAYMISPLPRTDSAPALTNMPKKYRHNRAASDAANSYKRAALEPSRLSFEVGTNGQTAPPQPPQHGISTQQQYPRVGESWEEGQISEREPTPIYDSFPPTTDGFRPGSGSENVSPEIQSFQSFQPLQPVQAPPAFAHKSSAQPPIRPNQMPDLRRANSAIDPATLAQLADANRNSGELQAAENGSSYGSGRGSPFGGPLQPPQPPMHNQPLRRNSPQPPINMMPTIPGTPAATVDHRGFDLPVHMKRDRSPGRGYDMAGQLNRERSPGNVARKPLPVPGPWRP